MREAGRVQINSAADPPGHHHSSEKDGTHEARHYRGHSGTVECLTVGTFYCTSRKCRLALRLSDT